MLRKLAPIVLTCLVLSFTGAARAAEITHDQVEGVGLILIDGDISSGDVEKFRQISMKYRNALVTLNSDGGELMPAIEIGKIIKIAGFDTVVPGGAECASACALIWVAGASRWLSPDGRVGFHASYRDTNGKLEESGVANALVGNYLTLLNLPAKAIVFATRASPKEILWLTKDNKISAGIDFEDFVLDGDSSATENKDTARAAAPVVSPPSILIAPRRQELTPPPRVAENREGTNLSRGPRPLSAPNSWVSLKDFPFKALGTSYENLSPDVSLSVGISVDVDSSGRVLRCRITASSGLLPLDYATCQAVSQRAVFIPGTDSFGKATVSRYTNTVNWKTGGTH